MQKTFYREHGADKAFNVINLLLMLILGVLFIYPMYFVITASISNPDMVNTGKTLLLPKKITFQGYSYVFNENRIWTGYLNTILYTVSGTVLGVLLTIPSAYALSRNDMLGRGIIMKLMVFTMFFSGGLIPTYLVIKELGMINTRWVMIIFGAFSVFNMIITRTYFQNNIPLEIQEAAEIDGCSIPRFFISIVLPLSKAIIAIICLYYAVSYWNQYFNAMIYLSKAELEPLQLVLRTFLISGQVVTADSSMDAEQLNALLERAGQMRYAIIIVSTLPIMCAYPFVQRYFVQGIMVGSVKG